MRDEDVVFINTLIEELEKAEVIDYRNFIGITLEVRDVIVEGLKNIVIVNKG